MVSIRVRFPDVCKTTKTKQMENKFLFFDTETNGKPKYYGAKMTDLHNWPRVAQLGWQIYNDAGELLREADYLIYPDGWTIPNEKFFIDNGMSTERNIKEGHPISVVLGVFLLDMQECDYLVAHNMGFDYNVLGAEMIRAKKSSAKKLPRICTMEATTNFCQLPGPRGFKWPKLEELHGILFNEAFDNAHDAMGDVRATARCFFKCVELGVIKLQ